MPEPRPSRPRFRPDRRHLVIFALALLVRLVHLWSLRQAPFFTLLMGDAASYDAWARAIANGDWLGHGVFYQSPLYPYWLGLLYRLFGSGPWVPRIAQAAVGSVSCVLVAAAVTRLFTQRAGTIAGLLLALYAPAIFLDGLIQKSTLDVFFIALIMWLLSRIVTGTERREWIALGLATGGLALTRENALVIAAAIVVWSLLDSRVARTGPPRRGSTHAGLFVAGLAIILAPVALRNQLVGGEFHLTTSQFGPNFYIGNHAGANGTYQPLRPGRGEAAHERIDATELAEAARGRHLTSGEVSDYWRDRAVEFIRSHPREWMSLLGRKFALLWNAVELEDTEDAGTHGEWSGTLRILGTVFHFGVLAPLAALGAMITWPRRRQLLVFHLLVAAYAASVLVFYVFARYRYPLVPFLALFAAAALDALPRWWRSAKPRARTAAIVTTAIVTMGCNWRLVNPDQMRVATNLNLGKALQSAGRLEEAIRYDRKALALDPRNAPAANNLGAALAEKGDPEAAIPLYRRAIELRPDYAEAHYNLGLALGSFGRIDLATGALGEALRLDPALIEAWYHRGTLFQSAGRVNDAIYSYRQLLARNADHAEGHYNLAVAFAGAGELDSAIVHFEGALRLRPGLTEARHNLEVARQLRADRKSADRR